MSICAYAYATNDVLWLPPWLANIIGEYARNNDRWFVMRMLDEHSVFYYLSDTDDCSYVFTSITKTRMRGSRLGRNARIYSIIGSYRTRDNGIKHELSTYIGDIDLVESIVRGEHCMMKKEMDSDNAFKFLFKHIQLDWQTQVNGKYGECYKTDEHRTHGDRSDDNTYIIEQNGS